MLGEHTDGVLGAWLGLSDQQLLALRERGVTAAPAAGAPD